MNTRRKYTSRIPISRLNRWSMVSWLTLLRINWSKLVAPIKDSSSCISNNELTHVRVTRRMHMFSVNSRTHDLLIIASVILITTLTLARPACADDNKVTSSTLTRIDVDKDLVPIGKAAGEGAIMGFIKRFVPFLSEVKTIGTIVFEPLPSAVKQADDFEDRLLEGDPAAMRLLNQSGGSLGVARLKASGYYDKVLKQAKKDIPEFLMKKVTGAIVKNGWRDLSPETQGAITGSINEARHKAEQSSSPATQVEPNASDAEFSSGSGGSDVVSGNWATRPPVVPNDPFPTRQTRTDNMNDNGVPPEEGIEIGPNGRYREITSPDENVVGYKESILNTPANPDQAIIQMDLPLWGPNGEAPGTWRPDSEQNDAGQNNLQYKYLDTPYQDDESSYQGGGLYDNSYPNHDQSARAQGLRQGLYNRFRNQTSSARSQYDFNRPQTQPSWKRTDDNILELTRQLVHTRQLRQRLYGSSQTGRNNELKVQMRMESSQQPGPNAGQFQGGKNNSPFTEKNDCNIPDGYMANDCPVVCKVIRSQNCPQVTSQVLDEAKSSAKQWNCDCIDSNPDSDLCAPWCAILKLPGHKAVRTGAYNEAQKQAKQLDCVCR